MKTIVAGVIAVGGLLSFGAGLASADTIKVRGQLLRTLAACRASGLHVQITENDYAYAHWNCQQGDDGLYYLFLAS